MELTVVNRAARPAPCRNLWRYPPSRRPTFCFCPRVDYRAL